MPSRPISGTPVTPLPIGGRVSPLGPKFVPTPINGNPSVLPHNSLNEHVENHSDPHQTTKLVPKMRTGSGAPTVLETDKATDLYFDVTANELYVCVTVAGVLAWVKASSSSSSSQVIVPDEVYNKSEIVSGVQHYKRQQISYDSEMQAWTMALVGDYIRNANGTYVSVGG